MSLIVLHPKYSRSVPFNQRAYALGFQWLIMSSLGSMPGPVLFGTFIDKTCNLWEKRCNEKGACLEYNNAQLSYLILAAGLLFQGIVGIAFRNTLDICITVISVLTSPHSPITSIFPRHRKDKPTLLI